MMPKIILLIIIVVSVIATLRPTTLKDVAVIVLYSIATVVIIKYTKHVDLVTAQVCYLLGAIIMRWTDPSNRGMPTPRFHAFLGILCYFLAIFNGCYLIYLKL